MEQADKLAGLLVAFRERDRVHQMLTKTILEMIQPTVLDALAELFECTEIVWDSVELSEATMSVACVVAHTKGSNIPKWVEYLMPIETAQEQDGKIIRFFRVNIPVKHAVSTKETVKSFLGEMITQIDEEYEEGKTILDKEPEVPAVQQVADKSTFDASQLTQEQIQQMLIFQHQSSGTKH